MHKAVFSEEFAKQLAKTKKKDKVLYDRLERKIRAILLEPSYLKHLRNELKGQQRVHIGPFVIRFEAQEDVIYFITLAHHDHAY